MLTNYTGQYTISSQDPELISRWFREYIPQILSANMSLPPWELTIRTETKDEYETLGHVPTKLLRSNSYQEWRDLGLLFLGIAGQILVKGARE